MPVVAVVLEEAQRVLSASKDRESNVFPRVAREGRKFNVGLCAITQQPKLLDDELLSQFNTFFILGLADEKDRNILRSSAKQDISAVGKEIQTLMPGECLIAGLAAPFAMPAKVDLYDDLVRATPPPPPPRPRPRPPTSPPWSTRPGAAIRRAAAGPKAGGDVRSSISVAEPTAAETSVLELTIVMPCLNEAETVATCVTKARGFLESSGVLGEVVVADNGSTDSSQALAVAAGARVVAAPAPGYGNALMAGIRAARGRLVIMGDADDSYDFTALQAFVDQLRGGADLVMGDRFRGGIAPGAMPALHRYVGNPVLSALGRKFFGSPVHDFHCGLRGFQRDAILGLSLQSSGMEFASEMVVKATLAGLAVAEVPTTLSPDGRSGRPHIKTWSDGWRHLRFLLLYSPRWMFLWPGAVLMTIGLAGRRRPHPGPGDGERGVTFDVDTLVAAAAVLVIGFQALLFGRPDQDLRHRRGLPAPGSRTSTAWCGP